MLPAGLRRALVDPASMGRPVPGLRGQCPSLCRVQQGGSGATGLSRLDAAHRACPADRPGAGVVAARVLSRPAKPSLGVLDHNIAYQGAFWHFDLKLAGLDWSLFNPMHLEGYGRLNCLKAGVVFTDRVLTVSRTYATEIQGGDFGFGLDNVMRTHAYKLDGIANGIDDGVWNPATDQHLPQTFTADTLEGKEACKTALREELGLEQRDCCLAGIVSRLVEQKVDLVIEGVEPYLLDGRMQLAVLGRRPASRVPAARTATRFPGQVCFWHGYNEGLAHRIEAGCDLFLMPGRFEPCGLNQMYSLRYGTLPLVRFTGGLADTVIDVSGETGGNGFTFGPMDLGHFSAVLDRALGLFQYYPGSGWRRRRMRWPPTTAGNTRRAPTRTSTASSAS